MWDESGMIGFKNFYIILKKGKNQNIRPIGSLYFPLPIISTVWLTDRLISLLFDFGEKMDFGKNAIWKFHPTAFSQGKILHFKIRSFA